MADWDYRNFDSDQAYREALRKRDDLSEWGKLNQYYQDREAGYRTQEERKREAAVQQTLKQTGDTSASAVQRAYREYDREQLNLMVQLRQQGFNSDQMARVIDTNYLSSTLANYRNTAQPTMDDPLYLQTTAWRRDTPSMFTYTQTQQDQQNRRLGIPNQQYLDLYKITDAVNDRLHQAGIQGDDDRLRQGMDPLTLLNQQQKKLAYRNWYQQQFQLSGYESIDQLEGDQQFVQNRKALFPEFSQAIEAVKRGITPAPVGAFSAEYQPLQDEQNWTRSLLPETQSDTTPSDTSDPSEAFYQQYLESGLTLEDLSHYLKHREEHNASWIAPDTILFNNFYYYEGKTLDENIQRFKGIEYQDLPEGMKRQITYIRYMADENFGTNQGFDAFVSDLSKGGVSLAMGLEGMWLDTVQKVVILGKHGTTLPTRLILNSLANLILPERISIDQAMDGINIYLEKRKQSLDQVAPEGYGGLTDASMQIGITSRDIGLNLALQAICAPVPGLGQALSISLGAIENYERGRIEAIVAGETSMEAEMDGLKRMAIGGVIDLVMLGWDEWIGGRQITKSLAAKGSNTLAEIMNQRYIIFPKEYISSTFGDQVKDLLNSMLQLKNN